MKTHYKANFSFTFTGHAGFILPCPAILQDRAFFKNLALPWSRAGRNTGQGRLPCPGGHFWINVTMKMERIDVKMMSIDKLEGAAYRHPR